MTFLALQFSPTYCYFVPCSFKYIPQHPFPRQSESFNTREQVTQLHKTAAIAIYINLYAFN